MVYSMSINRSLLWTGAWCGGLAGFISIELAGGIIAIVAVEGKMVFFYWQVVTLIPAIVVGVITGMVVAMTFTSYDLCHRSRMQTAGAGVWITVTIFMVFAACIVAFDWGNGNLPATMGFGHYRWLIFGSPFYIISGAWIGAHLSGSRVSRMDAYDGSDFDLSQIPAQGMASSFTTCQSE